MYLEYTCIYSTHILIFRLHIQMDEKPRLLALMKASVLVMGRPPPANDFKLAVSAPKRPFSRTNVNLIGILGVSPGGKLLKGRIFEHCTLHDRRRSLIVFAQSSRVLHPVVTHETTELGSKLYRTAAKDLGAEREYDHKCWIPWLVLEQRSDRSKYGRYCSAHDDSESGKALYSHPHTR